MNEKYLIGEEGVSSYETDGKVAGYEFGARVPYYFGVPLSQIKHLHVTMDGVEEPAENIRLIVESGEAFGMHEISTVSSYHWPYGKKLRVAVLKEGGLPKGEHRLELDVAIAVIYGGANGFGGKAYLDFEIQ